VYNICSYNDISTTVTYKKKLENADIADKPRDAFVQTTFTYVTVKWT